MFDRLGWLVLRLRYVFVAGWLIAAALFGTLAPSLSQAGFADETSFLPRDAESLAARVVIASAFPADSAASTALIVFSRPSGLTDADRVAVEGLRGYFEGANHPDAVKAYVTAERTTSLASMLRSSDGVVELARIDFDTPSFLPRTNTAINTIRAHLASSGVLPVGLAAQITGQAGIGRDYLQAIEDGTSRTTLVTILLVVIVLMLIYRAPLAALAPLITIGSAFLVARGILGFLAQGGWQLSSVLDSFIVVLVFGVGTDYTIFLISRFREELGRHDHDEALRVTVSRISAVITASAATVVVGLASMVVARFGMIQTTGPALAITIVVTLLAGLTLTPSLLAIFGRRLFWPAHAATRTVADEDRGFWAALARRITARPGLLAAVVLVVLAVPALGLPQLKENFDVLNELPAGAESRMGFETLSRHLAEGQLMPLTVLVKAPPGSNPFTSPPGLADIGALERAIAALPDIQSVRSVVDPLGEGKVSDLLRPSVQLSQTAAAFRKPSSTDINVQLGDASLAGVESAASYVRGLGTAYAMPSEDLLGETSADLATLENGLVAARAQALVSNQLEAIINQVQAAVSGGAASAADTATQLAALKSYLNELGTADPAVKSVAAYQSAENAVSVLASSSDPIAFVQLVGSLGDLSTWFRAQPAAFYFAPSSVKPTVDQVAAEQAMAAARTRLPDELDRLAANFRDNLYAPPDLREAYVSADGTVARLYVTTTTNPYDTKSFQTVRDLQALLAKDPGNFEADIVVRDGPRTGQTSAMQYFVGGSTAEFADVQDTISADFLRVAAITIAGILIVLILLLRALVAPVYLVLTVLLSYAMSLSVSAIILQHFFGQPGMNYFIPLMVFVLLVALGSDYNIFLMSRVREESATRGLLPGIRVASARTGTVITSAGLILAGTFGALVTSPLQLLFQVGLAVALGVLIDTFVVRSLLVPAITAFIGERAWWPFHRRGA
jgi:RND superfamily putative drug exporter